MEQAVRLPPGPADAAGSRNCSWWAAPVILRVRRASQEASRRDRRKGCRKCFLRTGLAPDKVLTGYICHCTHWRWSRCRHSSLQRCSSSESRGQRQPQTSRRLKVGVLVLKPPVRGRRPLLGCFSWECDSYEKQRGGDPKSLRIKSGATR